MQDQQYVAPLIEDLGKLSLVTLGGPGSRCDGFSGTVGDHGIGGGGFDNPPDCSGLNPGGQPGGRGGGGRG